MSTDVHNYRRILENISRNIRNSPHIKDSVKRDFLAFRDDCFTEGLSPGRIARRLFDVKKLWEMNRKDLRKATHSDIKHLVSTIQQSHYAPATKRDLKITLKKYVRFLKGTSGFPRIVSWIRPSLGVKTKRLPEELLTQEDIANLVKVAESVRDRAFISTLYESGCRIGEILSLRARNVCPSDVGMILRVDGKTGPRRIRVISSAPYLTELLNLRLNEGDQDDPLWVKRGGKMLSYAGAVCLLRRLARKAGINKKIYPHLARHSRATHLANHLTEAQMNEYFGWIQGSRMAAVYVHLSGRDVDNAILQLHGLEPKKPKKESHLAPQSCSRCKSKNPATHRFCMVCGTPLSEEAASEVLKSDRNREEADSYMDRLIDDPEVRRLLKKKMIKLKDGNPK